MRSSQTAADLPKRDQVYFFARENGSLLIPNDELFSKEPISCFKCFEDAEQASLLPFGDWRDLCFAAASSSSKEKLSSISNTSAVPDNLSNVESESQRRAQLTEQVQAEQNSETAELISHEPTYCDSRSADKILNKVFSIQKSSRQFEYANRRDVIIKSIVRYFYKYLHKCLKPKIVRKNYLDSADSLVKQVRTVLLIFGIDSPDRDPSKSYKDIVHFVLWIVSKSSNLICKQLSADEYSEFFDCKLSDLLQSKCEPACIMVSIMKTYSHSLLQQFFECSTLRLLFKRFLDSEADNFVRQLPDCKRAKAAEILQDFETNIFLLSN